MKTSILKGLGAGVFALALAGAAAAQDKGTVRVHIGGGDWADANMKAYVEPFEKETGIKVVAIRDWTSLSKLKLMIENKNVEVDVGAMPSIDFLTANANGWVEKIDYSQFKADELAGLAARDKHANGVGYIYAAYVIAYNRDKIPAGKRPQTWAQFWDVKNFPGARTARMGVYGSGPWEEALLADGVPVDKLYPMDVDRVFRSLDKLKPHITKWWKEGAENQQVFADGIAEMGHAFNGRITNLQKKGAPLDIVWNQGKIQVDYYVVPKGAQNAANAMKFIAFATRADRQAEFSEMIPYGPSNQNAFKLIKPETAKLLPNSPEHLKTMFVRDDAWYTAADASGKTNQQKIIERWNKWILE